jgi:hypothetical protein
MNGLVSKVSTNLKFLWQFLCPAAVGDRSHHQSLDMRMFRNDPDFRIEVSDYSWIQSDSVFLTHFLFLTMIFRLEDEFQDSES